MQQKADSISEHDYLRLRHLIATECGIALAPGKRTMLETRLHRRARAVGLESLSAYCRYIETVDGRAREWPHFVDAITTHKTDFFREPAHFDYLVSYAIPELAEFCGAGFRKPLLVWSAASSSGEEPYTIAMVMNEYALSIAPRAYYFRVIGTDIATNVLETAQTAVYSESATRPIPDALRRRYLLRSKDASREVVRICPEIRGRVTFRQLNLIHANYGFDTPLDTVFCRNVMIYFDRSTQQQVLSKITATLRPGGYLFMGHSESLNGLDLPLVQVVPTVYRRSND